MSYARSCDATLIFRFAIQFHLSELGLQSPIRGFAPRPRKAGSSILHKMFEGDRYSAIQGGWRSRSNVSRTHGQASAPKAPFLNLSEDPLTYHDSGARGFEAAGLAERRWVALIIRA